MTTPLPSPGREPNPGALPVAAAPPTEPEVSSRIGEASRPGDENGGT